MMALKTPLCVAATLLTAAVVSAHLDGAPPGYSGAPGEATCSVVGCHDTPPGGGGGYMYSGPQHTDTVTYGFDVFGTGHHEAFGFQLTVLDSLDQPFGEILVSDSARTRLIPGPGGRSYLSQTTAGASGGDFATWSFRWIRPSGASIMDPVYFYVSVVGADADGTPANDAVGTFTAVGPFCPVALTGDANYSGAIGSSDIIKLVGYLFKGGSPPQPCAAAGDVNCDAKIATADVIYLVNFVFKGGPAPCDVCPLIIDGTWDCY